MLNATALMNAQLDDEQLLRAMETRDVIGQAKLDDEILTFDFPDDSLERVANAERQAFTWAYCTHPSVLLPVATVTFGVIAPADWRY